MKAVIYEQYGTPDILELREVIKPVPKENEVLIKVVAASVNSWDYDRLTGHPRLYRLLHGLFRPNINILGADVAGIVEAIGGSVTKFKPGDEVFGDLCAGSWGAFAEYVCANENELILKPNNVTFEEAASIPQAGQMAYQGIYDYKEILPGHKILINGAGGGVGSFAIQMAKSLGAEVTGVDSSEKLGFMQSLGVDNVIDYKKENYTKSGKQYDLIIDVTARHSIFDYKKVLTPTGRYLMIGGSVSSILQAAILGPMISKKNGKQLGILAHKPNKDLSMIIELIESSKVKPIIDQVHKLSEIADALRYIGEGRVKGKIIITI